MNTTTIETFGRALASIRVLNALVSKHHDILLSALGDEKLDSIENNLAQNEALFAEQIASLDIGDQTIVICDTEMRSLYASDAELSGGVTNTQTVCESLIRNFSILKTSILIIKGFAESVDNASLIEYTESSDATYNEALQYLFEEVTEIGEDLS